MSGNNTTDSRPENTDAGNQDVLTPLNDTAQARRRLLRMAAYVPPAIVGMAILGRTGNASAGNTSCNPTDHTCNPNGASCNPNGASCNPNPVATSCMPSACQPCVHYDDDENKGKDNYDEYQHQLNKRQCEVEQAKKSYRDSHK